VLGSNPSTTNFLAFWRWWMGVLALVLACFGAGGLGGSAFLWRWTLAVGEVPGESILVLVFACFGRFCAKC